MKSSGGIIFSAVIAFVGSIASILFTVLMVVGSVMTRLTPPSPLTPDVPVSPIDPTVMLVFISLLYAGLGVWGIVSAIGLLRMRNWARICFAVYGGLLTVFSVFFAIGLVVVSRFSPPALPPGSNVPPGFLENVFAVFTVIAMLFAALGIWWVIYFTRLRVKELFLGEELASAPRLFPLSITIIAWILTVGGVFLLIYSMLPFPAVIFSFVLRGSAARVVYLLMAAVSLLSGIGMLRKRIEAHSLALGYFAFGLFNSVVTFALPGSQTRMQGYFDEIARGQPMTLPMNSIATISILFGVVAVGVGLWFMLTRRRAFAEACSR